MTPSTVSDARDQLVGDMKAVIADAEELLKATTGATGERGKTGDNVIVVPAPAR